MKVAVVAALFAGMVAVLEANAVLAQTASYQTAAGTLELKGKGHDGNCRAMLAGKVIRSFHCHSARTPKIIAHYAFGIGRFADVVIVQEQPLGSTCNGGPLHIIGVERGGLHLLSPPIDYCGGKDPVISRRGLKIFITLSDRSSIQPSSDTNQVVWEYHEGVLSKTR